ncbi:hypothetical protein [Actinacidiphila soli]|uniref:hypothetical protein n=1 Tax=Actinacidiphila soli TaxID=2487275 RepID=UPI0013E34B63|nr:hypothetical protein [Actinacidiphila soli]
MIDTHFKDLMRVAVLVREEALSRVLPPSSCQESFFSECRMPVSEIVHDPLP